jgi:phosphoglycerate kinase
VGLSLSLPLQGKVVLLRLDLNVPLGGGRIVDHSRIERALPTIKHLLEIPVKKLIVTSHLGRPKSGVYDASNSLLLVARYLASKLGESVPLLVGWPRHMDFQGARIGLAENVRFLEGECENKGRLAKEMSSGIDAFVFDAFASAHRAHASTVGVARYVPLVQVGPLMEEELACMAQLQEKSSSPYVAVIGGAKVSSKMPLLRALLAKVDAMIIGGAMANTFLVSQGFDMGKSMVEMDWRAPALALLADAKRAGKKIHLPSDVVVAPSMDAVLSQTQEVNVARVPTDCAAFDIGSKSAQQFATVIAEASTVIWNGPMGVFESGPFSFGTKVVADAVSSCRGFTAAGGGDTIACLNQFGVTKSLDYVSTGGGAFLSYLQEGTLVVLDEFKMREQAYGSSN